MPNSSDENAFPSPAGRQGPSGISRRPVLEYFNPGMVRGRFRRFFSSREKMTEATKTLGWVIPLTLLIWIYAEREQVVQSNSPNVQNVVIAVKSSDPENLFVESSAGSPPTFNLQLTGPQQAFEKVKETLTMRIPLGMTVYVGSGMSVGKNQSINLASLLQNQDLFKNSGVTVQDCQPPDLKIDIEKNLHREVPVKVPPGITNVSPDSRFEPSSVSVTGPESEVSKIDAVYAKLEGNPLLNQPGSHSIASVSLEPLVPSARLTISPPLAAAEVVVRVSDVPYEIDKPVPIDVRILGTMLTNNDFAFTSGDGTLPSLHVIGPQKEIDDIQSGKFQVRALLVVDPDDAGDARSKTLQYDLPPGVKVAPEDARHTIEFKLTHHAG